MKTVAIIPAYMEENTIADIVTKTKKYVNEVIVIDDGSMDDTSTEAQTADLIIRHPINMNKGFSMITGIEAALREGADIIVTIDADGQHEPEDIPRFLEMLQKENLDIIFGSRQLNHEMPVILRMGNWWLTTATYMMFGIRLKDTQSGFRVFTKDAYKKIKWKSTDYRAESEMIANTAKKGLRYKEITIKTIYKDKHKGTTPIDGLKIFFSMILWRVTR